MGIFGNNDEFSNMVARAKDNNGYFALAIEKINLEPYRNIFNDDKLFGNILFDISKYGWNVESALNNISTVYNDIVKTGNKEEKSLFKKIYQFLNENIVSNNWDITYYMELSRAYDNKELVLESLVVIKEKLNLEDFDVENKENLYSIISYPFKARVYYIEDRAVLSSLALLLETQNIKDYLYPGTSITKLIDKKIKEDKKQNGIYDIDRGVLAEITHKLDVMDGKASNLNTLVNTAISVMGELQANVKLSKNEINDIKMNALDELQFKANKVLEDFTAKYLELLNDEKDSINAQKIEMFRELERELTKKMTEINNAVSQINSAAQVQIGRITATGDVSVERLEGFVKDSKEIKQLIEQTQDNQKYLEALKTVSEQITAASKKEITAVEVPTIEVPGVAVPGVAVPTIIIPQERVVDNKINYFFDNRIPFSERFEKLKQLKERDIANGGIYHESFDDIAKLIMQGQVPYMYGPSGCGKTFMIEKQLSKLFNMNIVTNGYVLYEQDIIGYTNSATGQFVPGNFYRCYKYGDIIFLDELDNGIANATVVLNRFLGKNNTSYTFPDGIVTQRHPNFRIIAAGNTNGSGKTAAHNTRQKMDESVMQRLTPFHINYDNRVEYEILKNYKDWYYFAVNFREAIENMKTISGEVNTTGTFTTRDAQTLKEYLDNRAFSDDKLLEFEFIQTKDIDTLNAIYNYLNKLSQNKYKADSAKILRKFNSMVEPRIKR